MYIWRALFISYPLQNFKLEPSKNRIVAICKITSVIFSSFTLAPQQLQTTPLRKQFPFNWHATTATKMSAAYAETNNYKWNRKGYWYTTPNSQIKPSSKALHKNDTTNADNCKEWFNKMIYIIKKAAGFSSSNNLLFS